jgi:shikimate dehydrogenase
VITGATRLAGIIGDPVRHSLSPVLHNTAYAELGLDWVYLAFPVPSGEAAAALDAMRTLELIGLSVTMPHKTAAAAACDELTDDAATLTSVNTVTLLADGRIHGDTTDGEGFVRALRAAECEPTGARVLVLGAGGAARPVVLALARAGAQVTVTARRADAAASAAALASAPTVSWSARDAAVADADIVINATPVGMGSTGTGQGGAADDTPIAPGALRPGLVVADLVYHPLETPLLAAARAAGAQVVDGLGMLVHQAALQVERWSGQPAPVAAMRRAVHSSL